ncbi:MAG: glycosyltransferase family 4 protein [Gammaproteobacteria bacterium]|nr:glycosyltransferase family 4 protein [Gammaproteobacteria bacterium]
MLNSVYDQQIDSVARLQKQYWHVFYLAEALVDVGHDVEIIQAFQDSRQFDCRGARVTTIVANAHSAVGNSTTVEISDFAEVLKTIARAQANVVHVFGMTLLQPFRALLHWSESTGCKVTASFHGGYPRRNPFRRWQQKRAFRCVSAAFFPAKSFAVRWQESGILSAAAHTVIAPEVCSPFVGVPPARASAEMGIKGQPVLAWSGRLHANKDPFTALRGFERVLDQSPNAELLMAFQTSENLPAVRNFLASRPKVADRVRLLGKIEHAQMEVLFSAANFFVACSSREFGSNALVEALSCGCIPVLSDIPSFRHLTQNIPAARHFNIGDDRGFANGIAGLQRKNLDALSSDVKSAYREYLSYPVLAQRYSATFESL